MDNEQPISIKAILIGALVDIVGSAVTAIGLGIILGIILVMQGVRPNELEAKTNSMAQDPVFLLVSMVIGFGFTLLGGYVAGRVAGSRQVMHGTMVGVIGLFLGLLCRMVPAMSIEHPLWYVILNFALIIPAASLGGYLAIRKQSAGPQEDFSPQEPQDQT